MPETYVREEEQEIVVKTDPGGEFLTLGQAKRFAESMQTRIDYLSRLKEGELDV
ncbi:hypothetical protein HUG10_21250 (plasmid) [Halorarum halophilum]|uniref:Uncharacterized protein n=1 Tax=Halorarum halophilum TaxID=2743090 RepID=A0A7D5KIL7_9EURY|nr:hypothetical protein [Halobaculum halophilum]QLG30116.1 hypothetical protein HUG10_21250 [Halobaculum halophilum]